MDLLSLSDVPEAYDEIASHDDRNQWYQAVHDELDSMTTNDVRKLVPCPFGAKPLKSKWVCGLCWLLEFTMNNITFTRWTLKQRFSIYGNLD